MDKLTYLAELAEGLARWVPERERQNILRYYAEYFDEAGPGREAEVVQELGDPWALSCRLAVEGGFVTQEQAQSWTPRKKKKWPWLAAAGIAAAVLLFTVVSIAMGAATFGRLVGWNVAGLVNREAVADQKLDEVTFFEYGSAQASSVPPVAVVEDIQGSTEAGGGFWNREDGYLDTFDEIDVDISFGNVTVTEGTDYTLAIQPEGDLGGYELKWEIKDGALKVRDAKSGGAHINFDGLFGEHSLSVIITAPGEVMEKVNIETDLGDVFLSGVAVETRIEAKTALGDVECYEVRVPKKLTLKSDLGDVTLGMGELWEGVDIDLETSLGNVEANLDCDEWECEYELRCDLGKVSINDVNRGDKAEQKGSCPYKLNAESDLGNVDVYFRDSRWQ